MSLFLTRDKLKELLVRGNLSIALTSCGGKMLLIGCAKIKVLADKLDGLEIDSVKFEIVKKDALSLTINHDAVDDKTAKALVKNYVKTLPELKNLFVSIQMIDELGRLQ